MKIVTRQEAFRLGITRYFTGKPCKNGHLAERDTLRGDCLQCRNAYMREYQAKRKAEFLATREARLANEQCADNANDQGR